MVRFEPDPAVRNYIGQFSKLAQSQCAPLFWTGSEGPLVGGSMTFLRTDKTVLGLTNEHVASAIGKQCEEFPQTKFRLGSSPFDPSRLIATHSDLDLATYEIGEVVLSTTLQHSAATIREWPIQRPGADSFLVLGGWPGGNNRNVLDDGDTVNCTFSFVVGRISGTPGRYMSIEFELEDSNAISEWAMTPGFELGGWSGGGVYRYIGENEGAQIEYIELCGIICEAIGSSVVRAHDLTSLNPDGTFMYQW